MGGDWIDDYVELTDGIASPEIFRLWAAISSVAAAMERRLWVKTSLGTLYSNLYIMLVAPPGVGKTQAITPAEQILKRCTDIHVAPKSMTKAAVIDTLRDSRRSLLSPDKSGMLEYHSLHISVGELGVLVNSHDLELLGVINEIFDNPESFRERRRHVNGGKEILIENPQFNIIAGAQPALLSAILPEEAWGLGTTARFIMVFAGEGTKPDIFGKFVDRDAGYKDLADRMRPWTNFSGQFQWADSAVPVIRKYYQSDIEPIPDSPKLIPYNTRRAQFLIKLSMISAISRTSNIVIEDADVERARHWLLAAEETMPSIFASMTMKSDVQLIEELHILVTREWKDKKFSDLPQSILYTFLQQRVYAERIPKIIEQMLRSRLIEDKGGNMFRPLPRLDMGVLRIGRK